MMLLAGIGLYALAGLVTALAFVSGCCHEEGSGVKRLLLTSRCGANVRVGHGWVSVEPQIFTCSISMD
jgi:hypothetical protein